MPKKSNRRKNRRPASQPAARRSTRGPALAGEEHIVVRRERAPRPHLVPSTCIPTSAAQDTSLSLGARGLLAVVRASRAEGIEPSLSMLARFHGESEEDVRRDMTELEESGWLDAAGCDMCPIGHLCARTDSGAGELSLLQQALLSVTVDALDGMTMFQAIKTVEQQSRTEASTERRLVFADAWLGLHNAGHLQVSVPADGANPDVCTATEQGRAVLSVATGSQ